MVVNAGVDSMGGIIDGGVEISSAPSLQQSSDLEKTQAELRVTFNVAEKFRRELEFLQKGGDPLDLKIVVSLQSMSLTDQHPDQFLKSEVKGSFAVTASPHGDCVETSGRLGAPSVGEPNSADNLMLFDGNNKFHETERKPLHPRMNTINPSDVALDFPKKSYKRRIRSRPNRDGPRSSSNSRDSKGLVHDVNNKDQKYLSNSNSKPKSLASNSHLDIKLNSSQTQKSTLGLAYGPVDQSLTFDTRDTQPGSAGLVKQETLSGSKHLSSIDTQAVTKGFDSKLSCSQTNKSLNANNENELCTTNGTMELNLASNEVPSMEVNNVITVLKDDNSNPCPPNHNDNNSTLKEEVGFKGSESTLQHESTLSLKCLIDEDSILEEAQIIEEKCKRIAGSSFGIFSSESYHRSHWHFVLEEMSWLANDFAQERVWKAAAAEQISRKAAYNSRVRFQKQKSMWKQKEVSNTLAKAVMEFWHTVQVKCHELELKGSKKDIKLLLHQYGIRFLEYNNSHAQYSSAQAPMTPDRIYDLGTVDISWDNNLTEENLFYTVPYGAIEAYRKSIKSHLLHSERTGSSMQGVDASGYDAVTDCTHEEDMEETSTYYPSKPTQKKKKHFGSYGPKPYKTGPGFSSMQSLERNTGTQPLVLSGKRPANNITVSIPTKRVRTASRPRFTGNPGIIHAPNRVDASSGDTNSFHDEQSSLHGGSQLPNNMDVESVGDYEKQLHFDLTEVSNILKKKKKTKYPGSISKHRWQLDSNFQNDQKDHLKRRLDTRQFDSNENSVASQTSNMSNQNKFMNLLVRDRGRKIKSLKTPSEQQGSGSPWSLFEDQALVVLVHDMGANWEEGSARQLFQRLQGPMEEETLKSHFEKIIMIWQKPHYRKSQKDNQDPKQLQQPHGSHALTLCQVCPNNLNSGSVLTPLDLCETISPSPDFIPIGYQGPYTDGLPIPNHGNVAPMVPGSSTTSSLPGSSVSGPLSPSLREGRFRHPRAASLSIDEQHSMQQMNQMSARNMQQSSLPPGSHSGTDRGVHMLPGGPSLGVVNGMNRNMTISRPPFQGNSIRPRETLHMARPNQNSDNQRQFNAPESPHMPHHHLQGPSNHPAYGMRYINEKQIHQQRVLQQLFGMSTPVMPHGQQSQLLVSSPQSSTQVQSQSGLVRNQQTRVNHTVKVKQRPCHPQQFQPTKVMKSIHLDSNLMNGFSGSQSVAEKVGQKRYPGQQLPSSKQLQHQKPNHSSAGSVQKSVNQISTTAATERMIPNRKENTSDPPESNSAGEQSGPAVNHGVVHKQTSSEILPNSGGVQWQ